MPNGLKNVMSVLADEEKTNKALIADFQPAQTTDATNDPQITVAKYPATNPAQSLIGSPQARLPDTSVNLQIIHQNNKKMTPPDDYYS